MHFSTSIMMNQLQHSSWNTMASNLYNRVTINGLLTSELTVLNQGNTGEYQLQLGGGSVDGTNTLAGGLWTSSNKIIYDADNVITSAANLGDKGYASGLIDYATIFKALAIGDLAMFWEKVPAGIGVAVSFNDRAQGFTVAITAIDNVTFNFTTVNLNPIFETATSTNNVTAAFDNTTLGLPAGLQPDPADKRLAFYTTTAL